jgi:Histidine phosphatase superfamily (branch 1)
MSSNDRARWYWAAPRDVSTIPGLILLRHGEVASHRGDVPLTPQGRGQAERAGRRLARQHDAGVWILVGPTLRAQQTGMIMLLRAMGSHFGGSDPGEPDYLHGYSVQVRGDGAIALDSVDWKQADRA